MARLTTLLFAMWLGVTVSTVVDLEKRIYGGKTCGPKERRYHVKVITTDRDRQRYLCGGSLISKQWILTAAHCFKRGGTYTAYIGGNPGPAKGVGIRARPKIFNDGRKQHDLMLLKLPEAVRNKPVPLPDCKHPPKIATLVQVAGHASTQAFPNNTRIRGSSDTLQCADMNIVNCQEFKDMFPGASQAKQHEHWICYRAPGVDTCPGDSGGGVVYKNKIYGVHVMGHRDEVCASPAVFMDLCHPPYLKWIKDTIKQPKRKCCFSCLC